MRAVLIASMIVAGVGVAVRADAQESRPQGFQRLVDCRAIGDPQQRLACFDREIVAVDQATRARDLVVVDREQIRAARKSLFGIALPNTAIFGPPGTKAEALTRIDATIRAATFNGSRWVIVLEDGARWVQADTREIPRAPRPGMPISIRMAAFGSYLAKVDGQIAIRVRRES